MSFFVNPMDHLLLESTRFFSAPQAEIAAAGTLRNIASSGPHVSGPIANCLSSQQQIHNLIIIKNNIILALSLYVFPPSSFLRIPPSGANRPLRRVEPGGSSERGYDPSLTSISIALSDRLDRGRPGRTTWPGLGRPDAQAPPRPPALKLVGDRTSFVRIPPSSSRRSRTAPRNLPRASSM